MPRRSSLRDRTLWLTLLLAALGIVWRIIRYSLDFPLWGDEAFLAVNFFTRSYRDMCQPLEHGQIAPLGFLWAVLAVVRHYGTSEYVLRAVPLGAGILSVLLFAWLSRRTLGRHAALFATGVFAISYFPVRYSAEIKPYAFDLLVSLCLLTAAAEVQRDARSRWRWALLSLIAVIGVWCSYPAIFVAGGIALVLASESLRGRMSCSAVAIYALTLGLSFVTMWWLTARRQFQAASWLAEIPMWQAAFPSITQPWRLPLWLITTHTGEMFAYPAGGKNFASTIPFLLAVVGAIVLWRRGHRTWLAILLAPLALTFIAACLHRYPYGFSARTSLYLAPVFCLLIGNGLASLLATLCRRKAASPQATRLRLRLSSRIPMIAFITIAGIGIARDQSRPWHQQADAFCRDRLRDLAKSGRRDEDWVIFNSLRDVTYAPNLYAWGGSAARFRYYVLRSAPVGLHWSPPPDAPIPARDFVLIAYRDNKEPFQQDQLDRYVGSLSTHATMLERKFFSLGGDESITAWRFAALNQP